MKTRTQPDDDLKKVNAFPLKKHQSHLNTFALCKFTVNLGNQSFCATFFEIGYEVNDFERFFQI
jgi:hypothetical protein